MLVNPRAALPRGPHAERRFSYRVALPRPYSNRTRTRSSSCPCHR